MKDYSLYEKAYIEDQRFPIRIDHGISEENSLVFYSHWHEQLEMHYILNGKVIIECGSKSLEALPGDLIIINSNELHRGFCIEGVLNFRCLIIDQTFFLGNMNGLCEQNYLIPITNNYFLFKNKISGDSLITECIENIIKEHENKEPGYELIIKSSVYKLLALFFRNKHIEKFLTPKEYELRIQHLDKLNKVLQYINENYPNTITIDQLAEKVRLSRYHFCRLFKKFTGKSVNDYIISIRMDKAEVLLTDTSMNITEIALAIGFNDTNYFSRIFKKYKKASPSTLRKIKSTTAVR